MCVCVLMHVGAWGITNVSEGSFVLFIYAELNNGLFFSSKTKHWEANGGGFIHKIPFDIE